MSKSIVNLVQVNLDKEFQIVVETLTRIGTISKRNNSLYQTCFILHKRGSYYICHFKELQSLDGIETELSPDDIRHRNEVVSLLEKWGLCHAVDRDQRETQLETEPDGLSNVKTIRFQDKSNWNLVPLYQIGQRKYHDASPKAGRRFSRNGW